MSQYANITGILQRMFEAEGRRLTKSIDNIARMHGEVTKTVCSCFLYAGEMYTPSDATIQTLPGQRPMLAFSLNGLMEEMLADKRQVEKDKALIGQIMFKLLPRDVTLQEMRNRLPDSVCLLVDQLRTLQRTQPVESYFDAHDKRTARQYEKLLPKIDLYAMSNMIY